RELRDRSGALGQQGEGPRRTALRAPGRTGARSCANLREPRIRTRRGRQTVRRVDGCGALDARGGVRRDEDLPGRASPPARRSRWLRQTEELVRAVREAAGDDVEVIVDLHGRSTAAMGIQVGHALAPYRPWWLEEPCPPGNIEALAEVARAVPIPVAAGERLVASSEFREVFDARACAIVQPNVCYCGGITGFRRIAGLAEAAHVAVAPHNPNGPV